MTDRNVHRDYVFFIVSGIRLFLLIVCMLLGERLWSNPFSGALCYLAAYVVWASLRMGSFGGSGFGSISSYRMFSHMTLYAAVAVEMGTMMMFCHLLLTSGDGIWWRRYIQMVGWVATVYVAGGLYARFARRHWWGQRLAEFAIGAVTWVLGDVFMLRAASVGGTLVWSTVWACGMVLIYLSLVGFAYDFRAVGAIADERLDDGDLDRSIRRLVHQASLVSAGAMMLVMLLWSLSGQTLLDSPDLPRVLDITMMQLPVFFMLVAFYYALRQPLDGRNREKLMLYLASYTRNERVLASLRHLLVRGHKVSFISRLVCWVAIPFIRHKVVGKNYLCKGEYPSVFVCNHGFLYGPVVAALFLPTYFRPWIHDRMLREDLAQREILLSFPWVRRVLGRRLGGWLVRTVARLTVRLLRSFRPIPVVRGTSHDTMSTFDQSLAALLEGDNLMIFAEKPKRLNQGDNPDLRNLYTGFAHLGKIYYDSTGRELLFYPVFSNQKQRTIRIGRPVRFNPDLPPRDAKQAVAEELQRRMEALAVSKVTD